MLLEQLRPLLPQRASLKKVPTRREGLRRAGPRAGGAGAKPPPRSPAEPPARIPFFTCRGGREKGRLRVRDVKTLGPFPFAPLADHARARARLPSPAVLETLVREFEFKQAPV